MLPGCVGSVVSSTASCVSLLHSMKTRFVCADPLSKAELTPLQISSRLCHSSKKLLLFSWFSEEELSDLISSMESLNRYATCLSQSMTDIRSLGPLSQLHPCREQTQTITRSRPTCRPTCVQGSPHPRSISRFMVVSSSSCRYGRSFGLPGSMVPRVFHRSIRSSTVSS